MVRVGRSANCRHTSRKYENHLRVWCQTRRARPPRGGGEGEHAAAPFSPGQGDWARPHLTLERQRERLQDAAGDQRVVALVEGDVPGQRRRGEERQGAHPQRRARERGAQSPAAPAPEETRPHPDGLRVSRARFVRLRVPARDNRRPTGRRAGPSATPTGARAGPSARAGRQAGGGRLGIKGAAAAFLCPAPGSTGLCAALPGSRASVSPARWALGWQPGLLPAHGLLLHLTPAVCTSE